MEEKFIVKQIDSPNGIILVVTDLDLIGKKFETDILQLNLTKDFYQGEEKSSEEVLALVNKAYILHLTGKKSVKLISDLELVDPGKVLEIGGVPHTEVYLGE